MKRRRGKEVMIGRMFGSERSKEIRRNGMGGDEEERKRDNDESGVEFREDNKGEEKGPHKKK